MKKMNWILAAAAILILSLGINSCKKDKDTDNPNIVYYKIDKTITCISGLSTIDTIDFNNDGLAELMINIINVGADTGYVILSTYTQQAGYCVSTITPAPMARTFNAGESTPVSSSAYMSAAYPTFKVSGYREGLQSGEGYVAFRFTTGTKFNYGWAKVSVNAGLTEFKVLEYAYNIIPDQAIVVGAK